MYRFNLPSLFPFLACLIIPFIEVGNIHAQGSREETPEIVAAAALAKPAITKGPVQPTWESINANYQVPQWFRDAKFGIMMHWGLYSVPAHGSEWYVRYLYGNPGFTKWHTDKFGPPDKFGYKDFIPLFTCEKYDPDQWATLFKKAGAKYLVPSAEHHDGWANWDSDLTKWDAKDMGPKRDLIGDLAKAVRKQGMKFGVSNHRMNHYEFIKPTEGLATDLFDPKNDDFYWVANHSPKRYQEFLEDWVARSFEQIDKYQVDMLWYDMSGSSRRQDPIKMKVAAHYLNRAKEWGKEVALSSKGKAFLGANIIDYEREGRAPLELTDYVWQADDPIGNKFGYVTDIQYTTAESIVKRLIENTSKNGNLLLNISPKADGTIPQEQQQILLDIGKWLDINGEAIYASRPWDKYGEGPAAVAAAKAMVKIRAAGFAERENEANQGDSLVAGGGIPRKGYTPKDIRFTTKGETLYATVMTWPGEQAVITSLAKDKLEGKINKVELLGYTGNLVFTQDSEGLKVKFPTQKPCEYAYVLKITGLQLSAGSIPQ
ncbi:MAG: alpha-L-fucosidase [Pyrinomonadaceae bacterium]|nr:alpha-L-fucosidase [Sphingobacteriaceae bacterium]